MLKYLKSFKTFRRDEEGAVTVDWVVLTSAIVLLGVLVVSILGTGTVTLSEKISAQLEAQTIATP